MRVRSGIYGPTGPACVGTVLASVLAAGCFGGGETPPKLDGGPAHDGLGVVAYAWGGNSEGRLGDGSTGARATPVAATLPPGTTALASGLTGLLVLADGKIHTSSTRVPGGRAAARAAAQSAALAQIGLPDGVRIRSIAAGSDFMLASDSDGRVHAWGQDHAGQLGDGPEAAPSDQLRRVALPRGVRAVQVAAGRGFGLARTSDGNVYAWGRNFQGTLGDGGQGDRDQPVRVALPGEAAGAITAIAAGPTHVLALTRDGRVVSWGSAAAGQLGRAGTTRPAFVKLPGRARAIAAGGEFSLAALADGSVRSWGDNDHGQLGNGSTTPATRPVQVELDDARVRTVSAGQVFAVAITTDGRAFSWGAGADGQLGDGALEDRQRPVEVELPRYVKLRSAASGPASTVALAEPVRIAGLAMHAAAFDLPKGRVRYQVAAVDALGRSLGSVPSSRLRMRIARGSCRDRTCTATAAGVHDVEASMSGLRARTRQPVGEPSSSSNPRIFALPRQSAGTGGS